MKNDKDAEFMLRFTLAGRLLLFFTMIAAGVIGWLCFMYLAGKGMRIPIFLPFAFGAGGAALFFFFMRWVYRKLDIGFWSDAELKRREDEASTVSSPSIDE